MVEVRRLFCGLVPLALIVTGLMSGCGDSGTPVDDVTSDVVGDVADMIEGDVVDVAGDDVRADVSDVAGVDAVDILDPGPESAALGADGFVLTVSRLDKTFTLSVDGQIKRVFAASEFQIGTVKALDPTLTYDPYAMLTRDTSYTPPSGLVWNGITDMKIVSADAENVELALTVGEGAAAFAATMTVSLSGEGSYRLFMKPADGVDTVAYYRISPTVTETENFYGLGAFLDQIAHRGKVRAMQLEMDLDIESGYNDAHVAIPFLISTLGWGLFVESWYPGAFDCAAWEPTKVNIIFGTGDGSSEGFIFHLYAAGHPMDLTSRYYKTTGDALLPARWGLGPVFWKDEVSGQTEVELDLDTLRDLDLATTAYWIDRPYASGVNAFDFHPDKYTDAQAMIDKAHDMGMRMMLWSTPYISDGVDGDKESSDTTETLQQFGKDNNYFVQGALPLNKWGKPVDFTNPDAYAWFQNLITQYTDMGIEGFKLDYGEDVVIGGFGLDLANTTFFDGSTERTMHAKYQLYYHRVYAETLPEDGGFLICRRGVWGGQKYVSVIWPGDLDANFAYNREVMINDEGDEYRAVGGLPASMIYGLGMGASGYPFYGSDTGGYRNSPPNKEVYVRWMQQTALSSVMQVGNDSNSIPWDPESGIDFDDQVLELYRQFARLHLRLWPYEWTYAKQVAVTGHAIQRPIGLMYPEMGVHPDDQYMFGQYLLVAPVMRAGLVERGVIFPEGDWIDWFSGEIIAGGVTVSVAAPLEKLPLYLGRSGIVPLLRPTIDAIAPVSEEYSDVDSYATTPGILYPVIFPGPESTFKLFDGTEISQELTDEDQINLTWVDGSEFEFGAVFTLVGVDFTVTTVMLDGEVLEMVELIGSIYGQSEGWGIDGSQIIIKVPPGEHTIVVS
jgi:alpha-D-xyloside xylohydrolase